MALPINKGTSVNASSSSYLSSHIIQNFILIWLDSNINELDEEYRHSIAQLRSIVNSITVFTDTDECINFLTEIKDEKVFMIVSSTLSRLIVPVIQEISQLYSVYVFCYGDTSQDDPWKLKCRKVKGVFTHIGPLCDSLKGDTRKCDDDFISIKVFSLIDSPIRDLNELDQSFMYSQLLKEVLLEIEPNDKAKKQLADFCRVQCHDNEAQLHKIDEFERDYDRYSPIWWYTKEPFIYSMLNRALRKQETEIIIKVGFFIRDLHLQIEYLYAREQENQHPLTVYRGQGMMKDDFEKMSNSKGGLLSFNNFLSTSTDRQVSALFADSARDDPHLTGILFRIEIDTKLTSTPFVSLDNISYYSETEKEILFSTHTVFRIEEMKETADRLWEVKLILTSSNDQQLKLLAEQMRKELGTGAAWDRLSGLMMIMGEFSLAEELYKTLLDSTPDNNQKELGRLDNQLGVIMYLKGDPTAALKFFHKKLEIQKQLLPSTDPDLAMTYNNIGGMHRSLGHFQTALSFYHKAVEIGERCFTPNHPKLATFYSNLAGGYDSMSDYSTALLFYQKALDIRERCLPRNHPDLAINYSNIGEVHRKMRDYSAALAFYRKALEIQQKYLPPNHPILATTFNNIGSAYASMENHSNALSFYHKALIVFEKYHPPHYPFLAATYNNIGGTYLEKKDYSMALVFYHKALEIRERCLPSDHPHLASNYNSIGIVHKEMKDYSTALSFHQKALEIGQRSLPCNHPDLSIIYSSTSATHYFMKNYLSALSFLQKTSEILEKFVPLNEPFLARTYNQIGETYLAMKDYTNSLRFHQQASEIVEKSVPLDESFLAGIYNQIGEIYLAMKDYTNAFRFHQKALQIFGSSPTEH